MFFVHQLEEAYVQKNIIITATKETGVICPTGHSKVVDYNDSFGCAVSVFKLAGLKLMLLQVPLSQLAPDITMNDLYKFVITYSKLELFGELGRGSYGKVLKAKWRGNDVAVKQMLTYDINDPSFDATQKREVLQSYQDFRHEAWIMRYG